MTSCLKAIARHPELEVVYAADKPSLIPGRARLPEPPRKLSAADVAVLRGHADSMALRMACHDAGVHRKMMPEGEGARAVYEAVEQARVEAIGARRMAGVADNLSAMLEDRYHRGARYEDVTDRADAPIEDAVALMVREKLTGLKPPPSAQKIVDLWREVIEQKAGRDLAALSKNIEDQRLFARGVRDLLASLDMADDMSSAPDDDEAEDNQDEGEQDQQPDEGENKEQSEGQQAEIDVSEDAAEELQEGASEAADAPSGDWREEEDQADAEEAGDAPRQREARPNETKGPDYKPYTTSSTRWSKLRSSATPRS